VGALKLAQLFKTQYFDNIDAFKGSPAIDIRFCILKVDSMVDVITPEWVEE
jgi:tRNA (Thr-GGU) A37 N-methylase